MVKTIKNKFDVKDPVKRIRAIREKKLKEFDDDLNAYVKALKKKYEVNKAGKKTKVA